MTTQQVIENKGIHYAIRIIRASHPRLSIQEAIDEVRKVVAMEAHPDAVWAATMAELASRADLHAIWHDTAASLALLAAMEEARPAIKPRAKDKGQGDQESATGRMMARRIQARSAMPECPSCAEAMGGRLGPDGVCDGCGWRRPD